MLAQASDLGDGTLDNLIVDSSVHLWTGGVTVAAMALSTLLVTLHVARRQPLSRLTGIVMFLTAAVATVQVLLGIKLLDQGQGISQLYIHYVGGLIPIGAFLAGGWLARGDSVRAPRILLVLLAIGLASAFMAFTIGRAYVNG